MGEGQRARSQMLGEARVVVELGDTPPRGLVVVPPAGGTGFTVAGLTEGDKPEHVPYVKAGYAVLSFNMRGTLPPRAKRPQAEAAARAFVEGDGGLQDAVSALDLTFEELGYQLPAKRVFAAGHSSAASLVRSLAALEPHIQAVLAYAPVADFSSWIEGKPMSQIVGAVDGARELAHEQAPIRLVSSIRQPVFLFHAVDDPVVAVSESHRLATALAGAGNRAKLVTVPSGGHYDAMIGTGIPAGIKWLASFD
ncbi:MAG: prolyl oligopeptidase family serine peptidase [Myxococcales bacterium]|nr:prolyl oligopeptidase family serine peptidase [Myxococcales bacterium]